MIHHVPILMYHSIASHSSKAFKRWVVSPFDFENQLFYLHKNGYTPMTVSQFVALKSQPKIALPKKPVLITFDDGFLDFFTQALPILNNYKFASTLYVTTGFIGETSRWLASEGEGNRLMLNPTQLKELPSYQVEIGAHSHTHPQLDLLTIDAAKAEICKSKMILEGYIQQVILSFAYPHGYYNKQVRQAVIDAGFTSACGVKDAMSHGADDSFSLARIIISNDITIEQFSNALNGKLPLAPSRERFKTKLGRIKRRLEISRGTL